jgi:hypothetical protein
MTDLVTRIDAMSDGEERKRGVEAEREPNFLLARFERRFLPARVFGNLRELAKEEPSAARR